MTFLPPIRALALAGAGALLLTSGACAVDKTQDKGAVDESPPPAGNPTADGVGKADGADGNVVAVSLESPHPYSNYMDEVFTLDIQALIDDGRVGWCAHRARAHLAASRFEEGYDFLTISGGVSENIQRLTGENDDEWTEWFELGSDAAGRTIDFHVDTDYSITDHGFEVDALEWNGSPICPAVVYPPCEAGTVDVTPPLGACECPRQPVCAPIGDVVISHNIQQGFMNNGKKIVGTSAYTTAPGPADGLVDTFIGDLHEEAFAYFVSEVAASGLLQSDGYTDLSGETNEWFRISTGTDEVTFVAPRGEHTPEVAALIATFESLFSCDGPTPSLFCAEGDGYTCEDDTCVADAGCVCPAVYEPVCGIDRRTYSNACDAACADIAVDHPGVCGAEGDMCGGFAGWFCDQNAEPELGCYYEPGGWTIPFPDAGGTCRPLTYCQQPADCAGLAHIAVPGTWACESNECAWVTGPAWQTVAGWSFSSPNPYANDTNEWKQLYLPEGATELSFISKRPFSLEQGYDFFEVWKWDGSWQRIARLTGQDDPAEHNFAGRYFYVHFVSDYSVTDTGFDLEAQYKID